MPSVSSSVDQSQSAGAGSEPQEFGIVEFKAMATAYKSDKALVNAAAKYEGLDDAVAALKAAWTVIDKAGQDGSRYTPGAGLGFGSDNTTVVCDKILGRAVGVGATRKALAAIG